ncbi:MAG: DUF1461 domain-containing protein [Candidatus Thiothrix moscowensis]|nr:DUF1461 domain-containing protein [Candidatus Thiothrix moscowensis]
MKLSFLYPLLTSMVMTSSIMLAAFHLLLHTQRPEISPELQASSQWVWQYLLHDSVLNLPNTSLLDMSARRHMLDVKRILATFQQATLLLAAVGGLLLILQARPAANLRRLLDWSGRMGMSLMAVGMVAASVDFRWAFILLHKLLFLERTWVFPDDSLLIRLFPLEYFQQFFLYWVFLCVMSFLLLLLTAHFWRTPHAHPDT